jgi:hypothetical protein
MTIKDLKNTIKILENINGNIDNVEINFRHNDDSDIHNINYIEEDLFDEKTNNTLTSIVFKVK